MPNSSVVQHDCLRERTLSSLDQIAWKFLGSEFAGQTYADRSIDRRIDAYLLRQGLTNVDGYGGGIHNALLERVMANIGAAVRAGVLATPKSGKSR